MILLGFTDVIDILLGWLPAWVTTLFWAALIVFMVVGAIILVGKILDAIPFL